MTLTDIVHYRLVNQQITDTKFNKPAEIVGWLAAMQAQEYAMAKWAIGLRLPGSHDSDIEKAFNDGGILRTHILRPTWHFVTPQDIRWILALTGPRVNAVNAYWYRKFGADSKVIKRSNEIIIKILQGGNELTRNEIRSALQKSKINAEGLLFGYLLMRAELDGIICSGPRKGKQFTYALLDERVPPSKSFHREEALTELTKRYFSSRGPATIHDFAWWSGLTIKDARDGTAALSPKFIHKQIGDKHYIFPPTAWENKNPARSTFLMPDYDEYGISYKDRSALSKIKKPTSQGNVVNIGYEHMTVINGVVEGTWRRTLKKNTPTIETSFFSPVSKTKQNAVKNAIRRYISFFEKVNV